jgi:hypothetical protein
LSAIRARVNLSWLAVIDMRFLSGRAVFARLERQEPAYTPAFAAWAWIVVLLLPVIFDYQ